PANAGGAASWTLAKSLSGTGVSAGAYSWVCPSGGCSYAGGQNTTASGGGGTQTRVHPPHGTNRGGGRTSATGSWSLTGGNAVYVGVVWTNNVSVSSVSDTAGNTYTSTGVRADSGTTDHTEIWYAENVTGNAANVVTAHFSGSATFRRIIVHEVSGSASSGSFTAGQGGTAVSITSPSTTSNWTTSNANAYLFAVNGASSNLATSAGNGFTKVVSQVGTDASSFEQIVSATGSYSFSESWT